MGFNLMENFNLPNISQSIKEFWSRWHISLSTWFRDYVYLPLGGSRVSEKKTILNQVYVFLISGIWHGANWTFLIWGALHAFFNSVRYFLPKTLLDFEFVKNSFLNKKINQIVVFNIVLFAWIFFRASNVSAAFSYIKNMLLRYNYSCDLSSLGINRSTFFVFILISLFFLVLDRTVHQFIRKESNLFQVKAMALLSVLVGLVITIGFWGKVQFIYFQF
jgi:D-alanyl-lipoteichoic acid acyltransferase DltB (MBOAT superfamily)